MHLTLEGRSAHRSSRSAALRPTRARSVREFTQREARRRRRGAEGRQSGTLMQAKGVTHPDLRNPPTDPLSRWAWARGRSVSVGV